MMMAGIFIKDVKRVLIFCDGTYARCKIKDGPVAAEEDTSTSPPNPPKGNIDGTINYTLY